MDAQFLIIKPMSNKSCCNAQLYILLNCDIKTLQHPQPWCHHLLAMQPTKIGPESGPRFGGQQVSNHCGWTPFADQKEAQKTTPLFDRVCDRKTDPPNNNRWRQRKLQTHTPHTGSVKDLRTINTNQYQRHLLMKINKHTINCGKEMAHHITTSICVTPTTC